MVFLNSFAELKHYRGQASNLNIDIGPMLVSGDALKPRAWEISWPGLLVLDAGSDTGGCGPTAHLQTLPGTPVDKTKE